MRLSVAALSLPWKLPDCGYSPDSASISDGLQLKARQMRAMLNRHILFPLSRSCPCATVLRLKHPRMLPETDPAPSDEHEWPCRLEQGNRLCSFVLTWQRWRYPVDDLDTLKIQPRFIRPKRYLCLNKYLRFLLVFLATPLAPVWMGYSASSRLDWLAMGCFLLASCGFGYWAHESRQEERAREAMTRNMLEQARH